MSTKTQSGMVVEGFGEINVWLDRPRSFLRPERWAAQPIIREMIGDTGIEAIPITIGIGYGPGCAVSPYYGRTRGEAANKARDAAMSYLHGREWRSRPQSDGVEDIA